MRVSLHDRSNARLRLLAFYERIATRLTLALVVLLAILPPAVLAIVYVVLISGLVFLATFPRRPASGVERVDATRDHPCATDNRQSGRQSR